MDHHTEDIDHIDAGIYTFRVTITASPFNLNWFEFEFEGGGRSSRRRIPFQLQRVCVPQPASDQVNVAFALIFRQDLTMVVYNSQGQLVYGEHLDTSNSKPPLPWRWVGVYQVFVIRDGTADLGALSRASPHESHDHKRNGQRPFPLSFLRFEVGDHAHGPVSLAWLRRSPRDGETIHAVVGRNDTRCDGGSVPASGQFTRLLLCSSQYAPNLHRDFSVCRGE